LLACSIRRELARAGKLAPLPVLVELPFHMGQKPAEAVTAVWAHSPSYDLVCELVLGTGAVRALEGDERGRAVPAMGSR